MQLTLANCDKNLPNIIRFAMKNNKTIQKVSPNIIQFVPKFDGIFI